MAGGDGRRNRFRRPRMAALLRQSLRQEKEEALAVAKLARSSLSSCCSARGCTVHITSLNAPVLARSIQRF